MNLIVVYKGIGKIAVDQLKKLVTENSEAISETDIESIEIIAMEEKVYLDNSKTQTYNDPILFVDDVKAVDEIKSIARPKHYGYGVICGFAGPQLVLTVNAKKLSKRSVYEEFVEVLNDLTFQQISTVPKGFPGVWDALKHGVLGVKKNNENLKRQQIIYGVTKLFNDDLLEYLNSFRK